MKHNFKYIVIGLIISLAFVFLWQLFWLKGLYTSIKAETEKSVIECIQKADEREVEMRMDSIDKSPKKQNKTITISKSFSNKDKEGDDENVVVIGKDNVRTTKTVTVDKDSTVSSKESKPQMSLSAIDNIMVSLKSALHTTLDSIVPPNMNVLDSLIVENFGIRGIDAKYLYAERLDSLSVVNGSNINHITSDKNVFIYKFDSDKGYKIYTESLTKTVLLQMSGILGTTLLIILILSLAFWYLIRTVIQQRTLEEMKDDFTNNMTHELKTPIAVAYSAADALLNFKQGDDKEKRIRYLTICKDQLSELSALVEQILSMSMERRKTFVLNKEDIQLESLLQILIEQHKLKATKEVYFSLELSPQDITVNADRTHINNIISNLIDNAIKYSKESVEIKIRAEKDDKVVTLTISDNGIGIHPEKQKYIFEKFYRVTSGNQYNMKGYGLGLFYVKTMVEKHRGTISVKSTPHVGSVFTIVIPIA